MLVFIHHVSRKLVLLQRVQTCDMTAQYKEDRILSNFEKDTCYAFIDVISSLMITFTIYFIHYSCHLIVPCLFAVVFFPKAWKRDYLLMLLTMLIDLDYLLSTPIFDPNRCSINFHPLNTHWAMVGYMTSLFVKSWKVRALGVGCLWHLVTDFIDCCL